MEGKDWKGGRSLDGRLEGEKVVKFLLHHSSTLPIPFFHPSNPM